MRGGGGEEWHGGGVPFVVELGGEVDGAFRGEYDDVERRLCICDSS